MATYIELRNLFNDSDLRNRIQTGSIVAAQEAMEDPINFPTSTADTELQTDRLLWAARVFNSPVREGQKMLFSAIADNRVLTVAQITGATDAQLQTAINKVIDLLAQHDKPVVTTG